LRELNAGIVVQGVAGSDLLIWENSDFHNCLKILQMIFCECLSRMLEGIPR